MAIDIQARGLGGFANERIDSIVVGNPPKIGGNNNWLVWNPDTNRYEDSGVLAEGTDGFSPKITVKTDTPTTYILEVTDANGTFDTANLKANGAAVATNDDVGVVKGGSNINVEADGTIVAKPAISDVTGLQTALDNAGTKNHSELNQLDYTNSGHTGFASSTDLTDEITNRTNSDTALEEKIDNATIQSYIQWVNNKFEFVTIPPNFDESGLVKYPVAFLSGNNIDNPVISVNGKDYPMYVGDRQLLANRITTQEQCWLWFRTNACYVSGLDPLRATMQEALDGTERNNYMTPETTKSVADLKQDALTTEQITAIANAENLVLDGDGTQFLSNDGTYKVVSGSGTVDSVNGKTGTVVLNASDIITTDNAGDNVTITEVSGVLKINSVGGSGGTTNHAILTNLDYANSGHTGFATSEQGALAETALQNSDIIDYVKIEELAVVLDDYALKSSIPTFTSELNNDSGFITKNVSDLENYTSTTNLVTLLDSKQNKLVAGKNITIDADTNEISTIDAPHYYKEFTSVDFVSGKLEILATEHNLGNSVYIQYVESIDVNSYIGIIYDYKIDVSGNVTISSDIPFTGRVLLLSQNYTTISGAKITEFYNHNNAINRNVSNAHSISSITNLESELNARVTESVNTLLNYYLKTDTYNKTEVQELVSNLSRLTSEIVAILPAENISLTTIYLIKVGDTNTYNQYMYISGSWANLGTTDINLTNYYTKAQTYSQEEVDIMLGEISSEVSTKQNSNDSSLNTNSKNIVGAINSLNDDKLDKSEIAQTTGDSTTGIMSQKASTDSFALKSQVTLFVKVQSEEEAIAQSIANPSNVYYW